MALKLLAEFKNTDWVSWRKFVWAATPRFLPYRFAICLL
jgi:hypothetical protein